MRSTTTVTSSDANIFRVVLITALILLIPFSAMRFTDEVVWTLGDFVIAGGLIFGTGLVYELFIKRIHGLKHRIIPALLLALAFLLIWGELAVGIFD